MKRRRTRITDLNDDVLTHIMCFVADSPDGSVDIAKTICVCKAFWKLSEDPIVLKSLAFDEDKLDDFTGSLWEPNGLLNRSAQAGNVKAREILIKDVNERLMATTVRARAIKVAEKTMSLMMRAFDTVVATRARVRAFESAIQDIVDMVDSVEVECKEIMEQMGRMGYAAGGPIIPVAPHAAYAAYAAYVPDAPGAQDDPNAPDAQDAAGAPHAPVAENLLPREN